MESEGRVSSFDWVLLFVYDSSPLLLFMVIAHETKILLLLLHRQFLNEKRYFRPKGKIW